MTIVQMVVNGIGISLLPQMSVDANILSATSLQTKRFDGSRVRRSIGLMWRKNSPRQSEYEEIGKFISAQFSSANIKA